MNMCGLNVPIAIMDMNGDRYDIQKSKSQAESVLMDYLHVDNDTVRPLLFTTNPDWKSEIQFLSPMGIQRKL